MDRIFQSAIWAGMDHFYYYRWTRAHTNRYYLSRTELCAKSIHLLEEIQVPWRRAGLYYGEQHCSSKSERVFLWDRQSLKTVVRQILPSIVVLVGSAKSGISRRQMRQTKDRTLYLNRQAAETKTQKKCFNLLIVMNKSKTSCKHHRFISVFTTLHNI